MAPLTAVSLTLLLLTLILLIKSTLTYPFIIIPPTNTITTSFTQLPSFKHTLARSQIRPTKIKPPVVRYKPSQIHSIKQPRATYKTNFALNKSIAKYIDEKLDCVLDKYVNHQKYTLQNLDVTLSKTGVLHSSEYSEDMVKVKGGFKAKGICVVFRVGLIPVFDCYNGIEMETHDFDVNSKTKHKIETIRVSSTGYNIYTSIDSCYVKLKSKLCKFKEGHEDAKGVNYHNGHHHHHRYGGSGGRGIGDKRAVNDYNDDGDDENEETKEDNEDDNKDEYLY